MHEDRSSNAHSSDGQLLALHDHEPGDEMVRVALHVDACARCERRLAELAGAASVVRRAFEQETIAVPVFESIAPPVRPSRQRPVSAWRRSRTVVAALLVFGAVAGVAGAAAGPLHRWLVSRRSINTRLAAPSGRTVDTPALAHRAPTTVSFVMIGDELTIRLDSLPAAGYLDVQRTAADRVSLRRDGAAVGADSIAILPDEVRLHDTSGSVIRYVLTIPAHVTRLRVIVQRDTTFDGPASGRIPFVRH